MKIVLILSNICWVIALSVWIYVAVDYKHSYENIWNDIEKNYYYVPKQKVNIYNNNDESKRNI